MTLSALQTDGETIRAGLRAAVDGQPATHWRWENLFLRDPVGRACSTLSKGVNWTQTPAGPGEAEFCLFDWRPEALQPSLWKVRAELLQTAGFSPGALWSLPNVPLPTPSHRRRITLSHRQAGLSFRWLEIERGASPPRHSHDNFNENTLRLILRVWRAVKDVEVSLLQATDPQGRPARGAGVKPGGWTHISLRRENQLPGSRRDFEFHLELPTPADRLDLIFAVHRSVVFDFVAAPDVVRQIIEPRVRDGPVL